MSTPISCPRCGTRLAGAGADCPRCLLASAIEEGGPGRLGPGFLDDLPVPGDELVIAGRYRVLEVLGRGAMGVVYKTRQENLGRVVAVKMLTAGVFASVEARARFVGEAKAAAGLRHPNLVTIHDWGEDRGQPFFSMEYVEGMSLGEVLREGPVEPRRAVAWLRTAAEAVQHAHERGIIHRDLKPANLLLDSAGGLKITDFGIAKQLGEAGGDSDITATREVLGSPGYLAPEQATRVHGPVGVATDVYALGAVLYHLLVGRPPFQAGSLLETVRQTLDQEPAPLRALNRAVPRDLETIVLKCLEKTPGRRYASARELAEDLGRWERGEPIRARPVGRGERAWKWVRNHRAVSALGAGLAVALAAGFALVLWQWRRASDANRDLRDSLDTIQLRTAEQHFESGDRGAGLLELAAILRRTPGHQPAAARALSAVVYGGLKQPIGEPMRHEGFVWRAVFDPAGTRVATASLDGTARIWDAGTGKPTGAVLRHSNAVLAVAFSPDGRQVVTASADETARLWDAASGHPVGEALVHSNIVSDARFAPDGARLVTVAEEEVRLWDPGSGRAVGEVLRHPGNVRSAAFDGTGSRLVTVSTEQIARADWDGVVRLWDGRSGEPLGKVMRHEEVVHSASFSPDGRLVVTASADRTARVWDARTGDPAGEALRLDEPAFFAGFSPDGTRIVTVSGSGARTARLWEVGTWKPVGKPVPVRGESAVSMEEGMLGPEAVFSPDGRRLLTYSVVDGLARLWDVESGRPVGEPLPHAGWLVSAAFSPRGDRVLTSTAQGVAHLWDARPRSAPGERLWHEQDVLTARFDPAGGRVVTVAEDGLVQVWDVRKEPEVTSTLAANGSETDARFTPDGRTLLTISNRTVRAWDAVSGAPQGRPLTCDSEVGWAVPAPGSSRVAVLAQSERVVLLGDWQTGEFLGALSHDDTVRGVAFDPTGRRLVSASDDHTARQWSADTGQPIGEPMRHDDVVLDAEYSPDGTRIVTASTDATAQVWDAATGGRWGKPFRHARVIMAARFSPDGRQVVTASFDGSARLWDVSSGLPVGEPMRHGNEVHRALFSPDGRRVVTASLDGTVRLWDARTGLAVGEAFRHEAQLTVAPQFSSDGRRLLTLPAGGMPRFWDVPWPDDPAPSWFVGFLESLADSQPRTHGSNEVISVEPTSVSAVARARLASESTREETDFSRTYRWFMTDPDARMVSPGSGQSVTSYIAECMAVDTVKGLTEVIHLDPTNAPAYALLSEWSRKEAWFTARDSASQSNAVAAADFLGRHATALAPDSPQVWISRLQVLDRPVPTESMLGVAREATARFPGNAELWDFRRKWEAVPLRATDTPAELLDLTAIYNAALSDHWASTADGSPINLARLPTGVRELDGVRWDIRGAIHLDGTRHGRAPFRVPVGRYCRTLDFLHGIGVTEAEGAMVAEYVIHYSDGGSVRIPVVYGRDVRNWSVWTGMSEAEKTGGRVAWQGSQPWWEKNHPEWGVRVYRTTWRNPEPDREIASLDLVPAMERTSPFLIAVTVEPR